jgi:hypothetical protein
MDSVSISMLMDQNTKENGKMISSMVKATRRGLMEVNFMVTMLTQRKRVKVCIHGLTEINISVTGRIMLLLVSAFIYGAMEESMLENGRTI